MFLTIAIVASLLMILLLWVVFAPLILIINTDPGEFRVYQPLTFSARYLAGSADPIVVRVFGISISPGEKRTEAREKPRQKKPVLRRSFDTWRNLAIGIVRSFKLRQFVMDIDTGDVVLNAQLVPVALMLSGRVATVNMNFIGRRYVYLEIEGRLNRLLWSFFLFLIKK